MIINNKGEKINNFINYKITYRMKKTNSHYESPSVEVVEVEVEKGFAASYGDQDW